MSTEQPDGRGNGSQGLAGGGGHPLGVTEKQLELRRAFYCPSELLAWALCGLSLRSTDGWSSDLFSFP